MKSDLFLASSEDGCCRRMKEEWQAVIRAIAFPEFGCTLKCVRNASTIRALKLGALQARNLRGQNFRAHFSNLKKSCGKTLPNGKSLVKSWQNLFKTVKLLLLLSPLALAERRIRCSNAKFGRLIDEKQSWPWHLSTSSPLPANSTRGVQRV